MRQYRDPAALTMRELDVLRLTAQGKTAKEIGQELCIEAKSVRSNQYWIYRKLQVRNNIEAINQARRLGILMDGPRLSPVALAIMRLLELEPNALHELIEAGIVRGLA